MADATQQIASAAAEEDEDETPQLHIADIKLGTPEEAAAQQIRLNEREEDSVDSDKTVTAADIPSDVAKRTKDDAASQAREQAQELMREADIFDVDAMDSSKAETTGRDELDQITSHRDALKHAEARNSLTQSAIREISDIKSATEAARARYNAEIASMESNLERRRFDLAQRKNRERMFEQTMQTEAKQLVARAQHLAMEQGERIRQQAQVAANHIREMAAKRAAETLTTAQVKANELEARLENAVAHFSRVEQATEKSAEHARRDALLHEAAMRKRERLATTRLEHASMVVTNATYVASQIVAEAREAARADGEEDLRRRLAYATLAQSQVQDTFMPGLARFERAVILSIEASVSRAKLELTPLCQQIGHDQAKAIAGQQSAAAALASARAQFSVEQSRLKVVQKRVADIESLADEMLARLKNTSESLKEQKPDNLLSDEVYALALSKKNAQLSNMNARMADLHMRVQIARLKRDRQATQTQLAKERVSVADRMLAELENVDEVVAARTEEQYYRASHLVSTAFQSPRNALRELKASLETYTDKLEALRASTSSIANDTQARIDYNMRRSRLAIDRVESGVLASSALAEVRDTLAEDMRKEAVLDRESMNRASSIAARRIQQNHDELVDALAAIRFDGGATGGSSISEKSLIGQNKVNVNGNGAKAVEGEVGAGATGGAMGSTGGSGFTNMKSSSKIVHSKATQALKIYKASMAEKISADTDLLRSAMRTIQIITASLKAANARYDGIRKNIGDAIEGVDQEMHVEIRKVAQKLIKDIHTAEVHRALEFRAANSAKLTQAWQALSASEKAAQTALKNHEAARIEAAVAAADVTWLQEHSDNWPYSSSSARAALDKARALLMKTKVSLIKESDAVSQARERFQSVVEDSSIAQLVSIFHNDTINMETMDNPLEGVNKLEAYTVATDGDKFKSVAKQVSELEYSCRLAAANSALATAKFRHAQLLVQQGLRAQKSAESDYEEVAKNAGQTLNADRTKALAKVTLAQAQQDLSILQNKFMKAKASARKSTSAHARICARVETAEMEELDIRNQAEDAIAVQDEVQRVSDISTKIQARIMKDTILEHVVHNYALSATGATGGTGPAAIKSHSGGANGMNVGGMTGPSAENSVEAAVASELHKLIPMGNSATGGSSETAQMITSALGGNPQDLKSVSVDSKRETKILSIQKEAETLEKMIDQLESKLNMEAEAEIEAAEKDAEISSREEEAEAQANAVASSTAAATENFGTEQATSLKPSFEYTKEGRVEDDKRDEQVEEAMSAKAKQDQTLSEMSEARIRTELKTALADAKAAQESLATPEHIALVHEPYAVKKTHCITCNLHKKASAAAVAAAHASEIASAANQESRVAVTRLHVAALRMELQARKAERILRNAEESYIHKLDTQIESEDKAADASLDKLDGSLSQSIIQAQAEVTQKQALSREANAHLNIARSELSNAKMSEEQQKQIRAAAERDRIERERDALSQEADAQRQKQKLEETLSSLGATLGAYSSESRSKETADYEIARAADKHADEKLQLAFEEYKSAKEEHHVASETLRKMGAGEPASLAPLLGPLAEPFAEQIVAAAHSITGAATGATGLATASATGSATGMTGGGSDTSSDFLSKYAQANSDFKTALNARNEAKKSLKLLRVRLENAAKAKSVAIQKHTEASERYTRAQRFRVRAAFKLKKTSLAVQELSKIQLSNHEQKLENLTSSRLHAEELEDAAKLAFSSAKARLKTAMIARFKAHQDLRKANNTVKNLTSSVIPEARVSLKKLEHDLLRSRATLKSIQTSVIKAKSALANLRATESSYRAINKNVSDQIRQMNNSNMSENPSNNFTQAMQYLHREKSLYELRLPNITSFEQLFLDNDASIARLSEAYLAQEDLLKAQIDTAEKDARSWEQFESHIGQIIKLKRADRDQAVVDASVNVTRMPQAQSDAQNAAAQDSKDIKKLEAKYTIVSSKAIHASERVTALKVQLMLAKEAHAARLGAITASRRLQYWTGVLSSENRTLLREEDTVHQNENAVAKSRRILREQNQARLHAELWALHSASRKVQAEHNASLVKSRLHNLRVALYHHRNATKDALAIEDTELSRLRKMKEHDLKINDWAKKTEVLVRTAFEDGLKMGINMDNTTMNHSEDISEIHNATTEAELMRSADRSVTALKFASKVTANMSTYVHKTNISLNRIQTAFREAGRLNELVKLRLSEKEKELSDAAVVRHGALEPLSSLKLWLTTDASSAFDEDMASHILDVSRKERNQRRRVKNAMSALIKARYNLRAAKRNLDAVQKAVNDERAAESNLPTQYELLVHVKESMVNSAVNESHVSIEAVNRAKKMLKRAKDAHAATEIFYHERLRELGVLRSELKSFKPGKDHGQEIVMSIHNHTHFNKTRKRVFEAAIAYDQRTEEAETLLKHSREAMEAAARANETTKKVISIGSEASKAANLLHNELATSNGLLASGKAQSNRMKALDLYENALALRKEAAATMATRNANASALAVAAQAAWAKTNSLFVDTASKIKAADQASATTRRVAIENAHAQGFLLDVRREANESRAVCERFHTDGEGPAARHLNPFDKWIHRNAHPDRRAEAAAKVAEATAEEAQSDASDAMHAAEQAKANEHDLNMVLEEKKARAEDAQSDSRQACTDRDVYQHQLTTVTTRL
eukprot:g5135.t1